MPRIAKVLMEEENTSEVIKKKPGRKSKKQLEEENSSNINLTATKTDCDEESQNVEPPVKKKEVDRELNLIFQKIKMLLKNIKKEEKAKTKT